MTFSRAAEGVDIGIRMHPVLVRINRRFLALGSIHPEHLNTYLIVSAR